MVFNYCKAMGNWMNNFTFGRGVSFRSPRATEAIVPYLLKRVWEEDNDKSLTLWEMGQQGGVSGDCFVKIAYEEPWVDPIGRRRPGKVRILPLNSSFCFPEFHPHDRKRLLRFKLKYRFWGTTNEGTRQVFTYMELITESQIEEYINDTLMESRPNPLGVIPIVHINNMPISGSPWGISDIHDILSLNKEFNEKATNISDIINYYASPITVLIGGKVANLEKGPRKLWAIPNKDAKITNLELNDELQGPMNFLEFLKRSMHEMTGVPETALGQVQPISNTSGVAMAVQYQPAMMVRGLKKMTYGEGLQRINEIILLTLAIKEPLSMYFDPSSGVVLEDGQLEVLDPSDPLTYQSTAHFQEPLPVDALIKLNEIMMKMQLGLESKKGALRELGEEFVDEKLLELYSELVEDAKWQGALDLLNAQIQSAVYATTGIDPTGEMPSQDPGVPSAGGPNVNTASGGGASAQGAAPVAPMQVDAAAQDMMNQFATMAYGTKIPQRRNPESDDQ